MNEAMKIPFISAVSVLGMFGVKKTKDSGFFKNHPDISNFVSGGAAGFIAGNIVGPFETAKVKLQTSPKNRLANILKNEWRSLLGASLPFGLIFSSVCALEFSVNHNIKEKHGEFAGIIASATTGSAFLTATDHIILRMDKGQTPYNALRQIYSHSSFALWTGFSTMFGREAISLMSVIIFGPMLGKMMKKAGDIEDDSSKNNLFWNTVGRYPAAVLGTFISQPFDTITRELQKTLLAEPNSTPKLLKVIPKMSFKQYWRGLGPRILLAPIGMTTSMTGFELFSHKLTDTEYPACKNGDAENKDYRDKNINKENKILEKMKAVQPECLPYPYGLVSMIQNRS